MINDVIPSQLRHRLRLEPYIIVGHDNSKDPHPHSIKKEEKEIV
jgi:hypothetical protein